MRKEGQLERIAKAEGVYKGRLRTIDESRVRTRKQAGISPTEIAKQIEIRKASVYGTLGNTRVDV